MRTLMLFLITIGSLLLTATATADLYVLTNGSQVEDCLTHSYDYADGAPVFSVSYPMEDGEHSDPAEVSIQQIASIVFDRSGEKPKGTITLFDETVMAGEDVQRVTIDSQAALLYYSNTTLPLQSISSIVFADPSEGPALDSILEDEDEDEAYLMMEDEYEIDYAPPTTSFLDQITDSLPGGIFESLLKQLGSLFIMGFVIFLIGKIEKIEAATFRRSLLCAVYLSIVAPIVALPFLCVPFFGGLAYIIGFLFIARAMVMGTLEVLEGQAWTILILQAVILWLLYYFVPGF